MASATRAPSPTQTTLSVVLTTTFTPAPSCTNNFYTLPIYYSIGGPLASDCFPSGWESTSQYFSPGICPVGYTEACSSTSTSGTVIETIATCCPSGYVCYTPTIFNFVGQACASIFTTQKTTLVTDGSALTSMLATLHKGTEAVNGYGVSIRYKERDFSTSSPTSTLTTTTTNTPLSSTTTSTSAPPMQTTTPPSPSSGISTGAKAGIGIGAAVLALLVLAMIWYFAIQKRRRRKVEDYSVQVGGREKERDYYVVPVVSPVEVDGSSRVGELEGDSRKGAGRWGGVRGGGEIQINE